jgi:hypothetical protein
VHLRADRKVANGDLLFAQLAPRDECEGMIAAQLVACYHASMECYRRAMLPEQTFEGRHENLNQANKLSRTYATLLETLNRHRGKGAQHRPFGMARDWHPLPRRVRARHRGARCIGKWPRARRKVAGCTEGKNALKHGRCSAAAIDRPRVLMMGDHCRQAGSSEMPVRTLAVSVL